MNILPKKRWHVRTKENIARVRRDEAKAAEEENSREQRAKFAEQEARTNALRSKARAVYDGRETSEPRISSDTSSHKEHVNFFKELEQGLVAFTGTNTEYEREKKEEKEKYEKQIGLLTYLGQDAVEATGNVSWYNKVPYRLLPENKIKEEIKETEVNMKSKQLNDPLNIIRRYTGVNSSVKNEERGKVTLPKDKELKIEKRKRKLEESGYAEYSKHTRPKKKKTEVKFSSSKERSLKKKHKNAARNYNSKNSKSGESFQPAIDLNQLREKRLQREKEEKLRAERLLAKLRGETLPEDKPAIPAVQQKYSSQFNPHLAKQNYKPKKRFTKCL